MTSLHVNDADSRATLQAAVDSGVNFFDTAFCYGAHGESERLIGSQLAGVRDQLVIATKTGIHWRADGQRVVDGRPATLRAELEESLRRLQTDSVELLYLHAPDPAIPLADSAGELRRLLEEGKTRAVGASNCDVQQLDVFQAVCPISAVQSPYNMLQRQLEDEVLPWCEQHGASAMIYWPLMKGLLAGRLPRDTVFEPGDGRAKYPMFQGEEWSKNQDFVDDLRGIGQEIGCSVAQLVVSWTIHQPAVTAALCGAKRDYQIRETAASMDLRLGKSTLDAIDAALLRRGQPAAGRAV
jgi:aryl-alcohol dehydrogenase-like predicted oxidoreductase